MGTISEKELASLSELLSSEELLVKKFQVMASQADDTKMKAMFESISDKHQEHMNRLYKYL